VFVQPCRAVTISRPDRPGLKPYGNCQKPQVNRQNAVERCYRIRRRRIRRPPRTRRRQQLTVPEKHAEPVQIPVLQRAGL